MPQMGESIAEGTLSRWLKKVGDEVKRDEPIFEISTDKVDAEIPAPAAGVLAEISVNEGQTVAVGTVVARLETDKAAFAAGGANVPAGAPDGGFGVEPPNVEAWPGDVVESMSRIRQLTAAHMRLSRHWNAHVTSFFEIDLTRVARIRAAKRVEFERATGEKLTYL